MTVLLKCRLEFQTETTLNKYIIVYQSPLTAVVKHFNFNETTASVALFVLYGQTKKLKHVKTLAHKCKMFR